MKNRIFMCFPDFREKALTFSYDDGTIFDKKLIKIFNNYGLKGTFNISSGLLGCGRKLKREDASVLYTKSGMEIAVHGYNHLSLSNVDVATATDDVLTDRKELETLFGKVVKGMAYANGSYDEKVCLILENCGINYSRTTKQTCGFDLPENWLTWHPTCHHSDPQLMEYAKAFINYKRPDYFWSYRPQLFYVWGHSYEFNDNNDWDIIENFAKFIANNDEIWYATNGEIYSYVKAYDALEWSVDCKLIYNPSNIDVYVNYMGIKIIAKAGQYVKLK